MTSSAVATDPASRHGIQRLRSSREVLATLRTGVHRAGRRAVVHARPTDLPVARLTVVASKKVGSAVQRNRAKRLLREAARGLAWRTGNDIVLVARAQTASSGLAPVATEVRDLADQLDLLHASTAA